jgi:pimeloyl-ACP methyl ester carboxylesterase
MAPNATTRASAVRRRVLLPLVRRLLPGAAPGPSVGPGPTRWEAPRPDGSVVPVSQVGTGRPVLFVHAGSARGSSWAGVVARVAAHHRTLTYDRFTYRHPPARGGADTLAEEVTDVLAIARAVAEPVLLVGHSSGAVTAMLAALAEPDRVAGLLLYEPPVAVDTPLGGAALVRARQALDGGDPGRAMAIHSRDIVGTSALTVRLLSALPPVRRRIAEQAAGQIADDEALESLGVGLVRYAALTVPVRLLGGDRSPAVVRSGLAALARVLPTVEGTVILRRRGHLATLTDPAAVADVVVDFADRVLH